MALQNYVTALHADWYGNGRVGWKDRICTFIDKFEAVEDEREKTQVLRHTENKETIDKLANRTQLMILAVLFLTLLVGGLTAAIGYIEGKRAGLIPPHIFPPDVTRQVYADDESLPQSAFEPLR